jgi:GlcNAc-PI de-N-acetylase
MKVLHVAPHPDDELIGAPAHMIALREAGHEVVNYAVSLGRPADRERRAAELTEACRRAHFGLIIPDPPFNISGGDDLAAAEDKLVDSLVVIGGEYDLIVSPSPHDRHHGHEVVARAVGRTIETLAHGQQRDDEYVPPRWWMWSLWNDLALPSIICRFDKRRLDEIVYCLSAHAGEVARNDYRKLVSGRAQANAVLGVERVFGFGSENVASDDEDEYAELCCEAIYDGHWVLGVPHLLDATQPFRPPSTLSISFWLREPSVTTRLRAHG